MCFTETKFYGDSFFSNKREERLDAKMIWFQGGNFSKILGNSCIWTIKFIEIAAWFNFKLFAYFQQYMTL